MTEPRPRDNNKQTWAKAWQKFWTTPPVGESPAAKYSRKTIVLGLTAVVLISLAIIGALLATMLPITMLNILLFVSAVLAVFGIFTFLLAKSSERRDAEKHGRDKTSWMNYMGPT